MNQEEEEDFTKVVFEGLISSSSSSSTFEFDRRRLRVVLERWEGEAHGGLATGWRKRRGSLRGFVEETDSILERLVLLDEMLAVSSLMQRYSLVIPKIRAKRRGITFENGMSLFLLREEGEEVQKPKDNAKAEETQESSAVQPVSYSIGMTEIKNSQRKSSERRSRSFCRRMSSCSQVRTAVERQLYSRLLLQYTYFHSTVSRSHARAQRSRRCRYTSSGEG